MLHHYDSDLKGKWKIYGLLGYSSPWQLVPCMVQQIFILPLQPTLWEALLPFQTWLSDFLSPVRYGISNVTSHLNRSFWRYFQNLPALFSFCSHLWKQYVPFSLGPKMRSHGTRARTWPPAWRGAKLSLSRGTVDLQTHKWEVNACCCKPQEVGVACYHSKSWPVHLPCCMMPYSISRWQSCSASFLVVASPSWTSQSRNSDAMKVRSYLTPSSSRGCRSVFSGLISLERRKRWKINIRKRKRTHLKSYIISFCEVSQKSCQTGRCVLLQT